MKKSLVDLFAGCGGLSLGLEQAGFSPVFVNEINPVFCETYIYNHNIPKENYFIGDINELNSNLLNYKELFENIDIVCGGPPCQGFSMANRQRIIDDPRNNLYKAYLNFLKEVKPKFFVMENVKGMSKKIDEISEDIQVYLGDEYTFSYSLLNAKNFGVPQNRERFFIIGNRIGVDVKEIFKDILNDKNNVGFTLKEAIGDLPKLKPNQIKNNTSIENKDCGFKEVDYEYKNTSFYKFINNNRQINKLYNHKNRYNNDRDTKIFELLPQGENSLHSSISDIMPYKSRNHIFKDKYFKLKENDVCKTITSHMKYDCNMYIHPNQARGLTPREAARIQTFPDDYVFRGSQNNWYAQIGNAVPVKLAEVIGKHIIKHL
ncbi:MAG: DNA cytosine methyltransferase [Flavobacterium sp.]|uniref:DNA cytosine methyltransferase n=1 Tax=Flavobacterium sp. TaxID=239 RepID=UPI0032678C7A